MDTDVTHKKTLRFYRDHIVRAVWDEGCSKWWFSAIDIVRAIKIDYVDITADEFDARMADYQTRLSEMFAESHRLEQEILEQLSSLHFVSTNEKH